MLGLVRRISQGGSQRQRPPQLSNHPLAHINVRKGDTNSRIYLPFGVGKPLGKPLSQNQLQNTFGIDSCIVECCVEM